MAKFCQFLRCLSFLKQRVSSYSSDFHGNAGVPGCSLPLRVSSYSRPKLHLFCHLRTRSCVLIVFSRYKSSCTPPIRLTGCPEYPATFRRNWTLQSKNLSQHEKPGVATILSSPLSSCVLFVIVSRQLAELRF